MSARRALRLVLLACVVASAPLAASVEPEAAAVVEKLHGELIAVMKKADALGYAGREARLRDPLLASYDLDFMARLVLGRHWQTLSEAQQAQFVEAFTRLTLANYAGQFTGFAGEQFEVVGEEPGVQDTVLVKTRLVRPSEEPVQLDYRLHRTPAGWRIIDVYLNGTISELALRRSEYSALLRREGFDALMQALDAKIAELGRG